ncbi:MAG TPA: AcvB/VirJ family lysyl-phosphatidylglycerol hydrolase [Roseiarcus sp.]|nr:AcvB/VirJ family lysyl-phosphatidylglycerol hydrolase [Roseiarcus sp.]
MLVRVALTVLLSLAGLAAAEAGEGGRYGAIEVVAPKTAPRGLVILLSDAGGLKPRDHARLDAIAGAGAIAVGVDVDAYLANLAKAEPGCLILFRDAEHLSRQLQRQHPGPLYRVPVVVGEGLGGTLAGRIVAQSPLQTVGGGLSLDPAAALPLQRELCPRPLEADDRVGPGTVDAPVLKNPWDVALTPAFPAPQRARLLAMAGRVKLMQVRELPGEPDAAGFADLVRPFLAPVKAATVDGLPLVELPASPRTRRMAVFISGDGGWRDVDKRVSEKLQSLGVSVVGWDSLRYFWRRKSPDEVAADLAAVISAYMRKWDCDEVALIGFSFGASVMPFLYDRLDPSLRADVAMISLLSPGQAADWEIRVAGWFGAGPSSAATPLAPVVAGLPGARVQCFYGDRDAESSCGLFAAQGAEVFKKHGDHHMGGDYDLIAKQIFDGFSRRTGGR